MAASRNSGLSRVFEATAVLVVLTLLSMTAAAWFYQRGYTLYYGDAEAHLNMARRIVDSRQPGAFQIGGVWLPLPHLLMLPFVSNDALWRNGMGGVIPVAGCFVIAGMLLFLAARRIYGDGAAALVALAAFALNPNLLYLQSAPMTEPVFFAALCGMLYCAVRFKEKQSWVWAIGAGVANMAATMTRYDGWFIIPFAGLFFFITARRRRLAVFVVFGAIAAAFPAAWLMHNWWYWGDPLWFYNGPYSAQAIYKRQLAAGMSRYRGDHDWIQAMLYYGSAVRVTSGWPLIALSMAGAVVALLKRVFWPLMFLLPAPAFYLWSMHSGGTPIFMPHMWPFSYYNTRYGLEALPLLALAAGSLVMFAPFKRRAAAGLIVVALAAGHWLLTPAPQGWICWKESEVNSVVRRQWTHDAASFLAGRYQPKTGIFIPFGDVAGILREAGIPLREAMHEDIVPWWHAAVARPKFFLREEWAISNSGDQVSDAMVRALRDGPRYDCVRTIAPKNGPVIQIYRRE
jgi:hypothetical protein